jgi:hypothetical protein
MSKEKYFRMEGKKNILFGKFDNTPQWLIKTKIPMYRDKFQALVKEWKKPIDDNSDIDKFISWLNNKKRIKCYCIPKIYFIENNKHKIVHRRSGSFKV